MENSTRRNTEEIRQKTNRLVRKNKKRREKSETEQKEE
jgi:hypothetical protein